ncbi:MAG: tRNA epoxyqueuosine(34) reductase QueG [Acidimicrobiia bacterium]
MRDGLNSTVQSYSWVIEPALAATEDLRLLATVEGAVGFGVTSADAFSEARAALVERQVAGMGGPLHFTYDDPQLATDVRLSFPWAVSIVVLGHEYITTATSEPDRGGLIARFATKDSYQPLRETAETVARYLKQDGRRAEILIDDNRLADRAAAARSGLGWIGKSTMVLTPGHGPWLLIGSVVTDAALAPTAPMSRGCGTCIACIPACPTGAITDTGLDARRCLATWLQSPGSIPQWIRPLLGRRIYGCDECLIACPPGKKVTEWLHNATAEYPFDELLGCSDETLLARFSHWYVPRKDARYIRRNILVAAGNSGEKRALPSIRHHLTHRSALVRSHAIWALARLLGSESRAELEALVDTETVPETLAELEMALLMITTPDRYQALLEADEHRVATAAPVTFRD